MNKLEAHRAERAYLRAQYALPDPRKDKRMERVVFDAVYMAWIEGGEAAHSERRNPYPPGRRHDEFNRGRALANHEED
jgi:hypothetical protein